LSVIGVSSYRVMGHRNTAIQQNGLKAHPNTA
jgi:hypothetical protein